MCQPNGNNNAFLCPNGTMFNQQYFICDWWYNVDCDATPNYYGMNEFIYEYPESSSGEQFNDQEVRSGKQFNGQEIRSGKQTDEFGFPIESPQLDGFPGGLPTNTPLGVQIALAGLTHFVYIKVYFFSAFSKDTVKKSSLKEKGIRTKIRISCPD